MIPLPLKRESLRPNEGGLLLRYLLDFHQRIEFQRLPQHDRLSPVVGGEGVDVHNQLLLYLRLQFLPCLQPQLGEEG